jgi:membrane protein implicated in regulation of membrane protease activity
MTKQMPTFVRYLLFQLPQWVLLALFLWFLVDRTAVPVWATIGFFLVWVAKDLAIYPIVRPAYETDHRIGAERLIGSRGVAHETLDPEGYVRINGELWKARVESKDPPVAKDSAVTVTGARGLLLTVKAA